MTATICVNDRCFYNETILRLEDLTWTHRWNNALETLDVVGLCPSCQTECERHELADLDTIQRRLSDGSIQTELPLTPERESE